MLSEVPDKRSTRLKHRGFGAVGVRAKSSNDSEMSTIGDTVKLRRGSPAMGGEEAVRGQEREDESEEEGGGQSGF